MAASINVNGAEVSSEALTGLKSDLTQLSEYLLELYDLMTADMTQVGEYWRDPKYEEFQSGYSKQIKECERISQRYTEWCGKVLDPTIERVIAIERTDVGGDGGSISTSGGGVSDNSGISSSSSGGQKGKDMGFNLSGKGDTSELTSKIDAFLNREKTRKPLSKADKACIDEFGAGYHGVPSAHADAHGILDDSISATTGNNKVSAGIGFEAFGIKASAESEANSGTGTRSKAAKWGVRCEPDV